MLHRFRPSPALIVAVLALFVALGGVSYAATKIGTAQIKNGAVTAKKLHKKAVTTKKIKNRAVTELKIAFQAVGTSELADAGVTNSKLADNSVQTGKIADAAVTSTKIADAAITDTKLADGSVTTTKLDDAAVTDTKLADLAVTAPKIASGAVGADQLSDDTNQVVSSPVTLTAGGSGFTTVTCPAGSQVLSGGGGASSYLVAGVESFAVGNGWLWAAHNYDGANAQTIRAYALCLFAASSSAQPRVTHARVLPSRPPVPTH